MVARVFSLQKKRYKILKSNATDCYRQSSESRRLMQYSIETVEFVLLFPPVCYFCGSLQEMLSNNDFVQSLQTQYAVLCLICFFSSSVTQRVSLLQFGDLQCFRMIFLMRDIFHF